MESTNDNQGINDRIDTLIDEINRTTISMDGELGLNEPTGWRFTTGYIPTSTTTAAISNEVVPPIDDLAMREYVPFHTQALIDTYTGTHWPLNIGTLTLKPDPMKSYLEQLKKMEERVIRLSEDYSLKHEHVRIKESKAITKRLDEDRVKLLSELQDILEEVYPGRHDIQFDFMLKYKDHVNEYGATGLEKFEVPVGITIKGVYIVLHFPEITIKNKRGESMLLKDMFVRLRVFPKIRYGINSKNIHLHISSIDGYRSTLSLEEADSSYVHSHLPTVHFFDVFTGGSRKYGYTSFCLGASDINMTVGLLADKYTPELFKVLLFNIQTFLEWESVDTRPHIQMSHVITRAYDYPDMSHGDCREVYDKIIKRIKSNGVPLHLNWGFNGKYYIVDDDKLEGLFREVGLSSKFFVYRDPSGKYFVQKHGNKPGEYPNIWIAFRGKKIVLKIEGEIKKVVNIQAYIHPKIKQYVKSQLELCANAAKIKEAGIKKLYTNNST